MYKKMIVKRRLKHKCDYCNKSFKKGDVYYKERQVFTDFIDGKVNVTAYSNFKCPKCKYKDEDHMKRFNKFKTKCNHPEEFIDTIWGYIPGECVKEPQCEHCKLCGKILY